MKYLVLILLLPLAFISCSSPKQENNQDVYDFHIIYSYQGTQIIDSSWRINRLDRNKLYINLEGWFSNDTISIEDNKHKIADKEVVTTEPSTETASYYEVENIDEIEYLTFKINSSPKVSFEIARKDFFIIGIRKGTREHKKEITVVFYKKAPMYD